MRWAEIWCDATIPRVRCEAVPRCCWCGCFLTTDSPDGQCGHWYLQATPSWSRSHASSPCSTLQQSALQFCSTLLCSTLLCSTLLCRLMWRWQENPQYSKQLSVSAIIRFFLLQEIRIFYGISDEIRGELILTRRYNSRTPKVKQYLSFVKDLPLTRIIQIWGKLSNNYLDFYKTLLVTVNLVSFHT